MKTLDSVYLVDDDVTYQYIAKRTLEGTGLVRNIDVFSNGLDALYAIVNAKHSTEALPDVILLDLMMPVMDGWGFLDKYAAVKPGIQKNILIYIVSSSFHPVDVDRANKISDVSGYIVKPITKQKFIDLVNELQ